jgi:hypothetical protein
VYDKIVCDEIGEHDPLWGSEARDEPDILRITLGSEARDEPDSWMNASHAFGHMGMSQHDYILHISATENIVHGLTDSL